MITTSSHVKTDLHLRDSPSLVLVPLYAWASSSSRRDPWSHLAPDSNTTWHASPAMDHHRNKHLDTTRLTNLTSTRCANLHAHDPLTHTLSDDDLYEIPDTAPRHHLSHQRSSSSTAFMTTTPCRLLCVTPLSTITHRLADDGVLAIFTRSLHRPTIARPEALVESPPRGKRSFKSSTWLWYQLFELAHRSIIWS
jgi:hypothetical protein